MLRVTLLNHRDSIYAISFVRAFQQGHILEILNAPSLSCLKTVRGANDRTPFDAKGIDHVIVINKHLLQRNPEISISILPVVADATRAAQRHLGIRGGSFP